MTTPPRPAPGVVRASLVAALVLVTLGVVGLPATTAARERGLRPAAGAGPGWGAARIGDTLQAAPVRLSDSARRRLRGLPAGATVAFHPVTGQVRFLAGTRARPLATVADLRAASRRRPAAGAASASGVASDRVARAWLTGIAPLFGVRRVTDLRTERVRRTGDGRTVLRYRQQRDGVPVIGGELLVGLDRRGQVTSVSGEALPEADQPATQPTVSARAARDIAADWLARDAGIARSAVTTRSEGLAILDPRLLGTGGPPIPRLVWQVDARAGAGPGDPRRTSGALADATVPAHQLILVDARRGQVLEHLPRVASGLVRRICDQESRRLKEFRCTPDKVVRGEGDGPSGRSQADALYRLLAVVDAFWRDRFGRDGIDGEGSAFTGVVRTCILTWCPMQNAFWEWGPQQASFGSGWASVDDLVGHEFAHGVLDHEARLFYDHQSGALNESFADILGEGFDLLNDWGDDAAGVRWLIGEDLPLGTARDMQDPGRFGDPDRVGSARWYASSADSGGVHSNSGVGNKAASLIADGGRFNGYQVRGIGLGAMLRVEYEAYSNRLTSASDYLDLHDALVQACIDLVGSGGITLGSCRSVRDAVDATEMHLLPQSAAPRQAPTCGTGRYPVTTFLDDMEHPGDGAWASRSLRPARNPWYYPPNPSRDADWDGTWASSGEGNLFGDDLARVTDAVIELTRSVTVPSRGLLRFEHGYRFDVGSRFFDGGVVEFSVAGGPWRDLGSRIRDAGYTGTLAGGTGNPLRGRRAFVGLSRGWGATRIDLSDLAGRPIRLRFRVATDRRHGSMGWYIDDVRIYRCVRDRVAPTGGVTIGDGGDRVTQAVQTLTIVGRDATSGVSRMRVSNAGTLTRGLLRDGIEMPFRETLRWLLTDTAWGGTTGDGPKRVWVQLRDRAGNWSEPFSAMTRLEPGPPG